MILQLAVFLLTPLLVHGHGNMVHPPVWMDRSARTPEGRLEWPGCGVLDDQIPETEWQNTTQRSPSCLNYWFTNNTVTSGEVTIPEDMSQPEALCKQHGSTSNPWLAPGTAPVFSPCGTMGGNPLGCRGDGVGNFGDVCIFADETFPGGFAKGWNAEEFDWKNLRRERGEVCREDTSEGRPRADPLPRGGRQRADPLPRGDQGTRGEPR